MTRLTCFVTVTVLALTFGVSAWAQVPGEYLGTNSEGYTVELVVAQNSSGGLFLGLVRESALFYCDGKLATANGRESAYGASLYLTAPIENGVVTFGASSNDLSGLRGTVSFEGNTVSGNLVAYDALFSGSAEPPSNAEAKSCHSRSLHFTAQPADPLH